MLKIRFFSICIFLCVILSTGSIYAGDYFRDAFRFYSEGKYHMASIEFEKAIFYETDNSKIALGKYFKSICLKKLGNSEKALEELDEIPVFNLPDSLFLLIKYEQAYNNFILNEPGRSLLNIEDLRSRIPDTLQTISVIPITILSLNAMRKWEDAEKYWVYFLEHSELSDSIRLAIASEISTLYNRKNLPRYHSPKKAENLSRFIPGSGQIYCGFVREGLFNFFMNSAILGFSLYEFYTGYYFTGYIVGLSILNKTYMGGIHRAEHLANEKNQKELRIFNYKSSSILDTVLSMNH